MYDFINNITNPYIPKLALIVYHEDESPNSRNSFYAEIREINQKGQMLAGKPLTEDVIKGLIKEFKEKEEENEKEYGIIPETLIYFNNNPGKEKYIWYQSPGKRQMYFSKHLAIPEGEYQMPGIIYVCTGKNSLSVYAFKGKTPTPKTRLYKAPFFNVNGSSVCLGSYKSPKIETPTYSNILNHWEQIFWNTQFTHLGGSENPTKDNLVIVTKNSIENFDYTQLLPINNGSTKRQLTLQNILP